MRKVCFLPRQLVGGGLRFHAGHIHAPRHIAPHLGAKGQADIGLAARGQLFLPLGNVVLQGARSIPLGELEAKLPGVVKNKATPLVLVCASGMRSGRAVAIAKKLGYDNAQSLAGGLKSWRDANLPIEKS